MLEHYISNLIATEYFEVTIFGIQVIYQGKRITTVKKIELKNLFPFNNLKVNIQSRPQALNNSTMF